MGCDSPRPLTTAEAKARLRAVAERASPSAWLQQHPMSALAIAAIGGFVIARMRLPSAGGLLLAEKLITPILFGVARGKENSRD